MAKLRNQKRMNWTILLVEIKNELSISHHYCFFLGNNKLQLSKNYLQRSENYLPRKNVLIVKKVTKDQILIAKLKFWSNA